MLNTLVIAYMALLLLRPNEFLDSMRNVPILQFLLLGCMVAWLFSAQKDLKYPQFRLALWFTIAAMLSVGFAGWWGGSLYRLAYLAPIIILFVLLANTATELRTLHRIMVVCVLCSCVMVLHGRWQLADGVGWTGLPLLEGRITYAGIFSDPNDLGQLFVISIAFCVYLYRKTSGLGKLTLFAAVVWLCYGIYMTDSRGTILASLPVLAIEGTRRYGKIVVGVLGGLACAALVATTRFGQISAGEQAANQRIESWYEGTQMFLTHPFVGVGMGNYTEHWYLTAHNFIVLPMAELGLLGFVPWVGILWFSGRMLIWLTKRGHVARDPALTSQADIDAEYEASVALTAVAVGFVISSFFLSQSYKHILFIVVALIVARFLHARTILADAPKFSILADLPKIVAVSLAAAFGMWVIMRILL